MADTSGLLMLVGAATPPGRLATAIAAVAEMARSRHTDLGVDILNLAETPVEICDGRPLDAYGQATRNAVARIVGAGDDPVPAIAGRVENPRRAFVVLDEGAVRTAPQLRRLHKQVLRRVP